MSGHSKWSKIKRKKGANDEARGKVFTKLSKNISLAAQQGGGDTDMNFSLRIAVDKAKAENLPSDKIERAIKKGTGELKDGNQIIQLIYEGFGPGSTGILIQSQTDNTNRALTEIKTIINSKGGKLSGEGSVSWQFQEKGTFILSPKRFVKSEKYGKDGDYVDVDPDEMMLELMEISGVDDVQYDDEGGVIEAFSGRTDFNTVHDKFQESGFKIEEAELGWVPTETVKINAQQEEQLESLIEALDESDEVTNVWHNAA